MKIKIYQVDAFAEAAFEGNPAAVCPLDAWLPDSILQSIALENNLSETGFYVAEKAHFRLRWFTPRVEVDLCGHATLAAAHVLFKYEGFTGEHVVFQTRSGELRVSKAGKSSYRMDFPLDTLEALPADHAVGEFFSFAPVEVFKGKTDYLLVYGEQSAIEGVKVNFRGLAEFDGRGVICTAPGRTADYVSRGFFPQAGIDEDPATGSAQTTQAAYWNERLEKTAFSALQLSERGGSFQTEVVGERCYITGRAHDYMQGEINLTIL